MPLYGAIIQRYLSEVSGPLLDRIDLHIEVPAVPYKELRANDAGTARRKCESESTRPGHPAGSRLLQCSNSVESRPQIVLTGRIGERTLEMAVRRMALSARAHDRILKVARTIADFDRVGPVAAKHSPKPSVSKFGSELLDVVTHPARVVL